MYLLIISFIIQLSFLSLIGPPILLSVFLNIVIFV